LFFLFLFLFFGLTCRRSPTALSLLTLLLLPVPSTEVLPPLPDSPLTLVFLHCSVIVLGESGVGKTNFIHRFIDQVYSPELLPKTVSVDISSSEFQCLDGRHLKCCLPHLPRFLSSVPSAVGQIWDTSGDLENRKLVNVYLRFDALPFPTFSLFLSPSRSCSSLSLSLPPPPTPTPSVLCPPGALSYPFGGLAAGVLLLYDISNRDSFEKISSWIGLLQSLSIITPLLFHLVGTKVSLPPFPASLCSEITDSLCCAEDRAILMISLREK
jgi:GTPase SAR1 family protein